MILALKVPAVLLIFTGAFFELFPLSPGRNPRLSFRKGDLSAYISGTAFTIAGFLIALILFLATP